MTLTTVLFTAQITLRTLVVAHACLKTYKRARQAYKWLYPPAACLWNSFVYVDVVPTVESSKQKMSLPPDNGREEERVGRPRDAGGSQEEEAGDWVKL